MIPDKRQEAIFELIKLNKTISIAEIVKELNISQMTVRRDLEAIENSNHQIVRIRGGAKYIETDIEENNTNYLNNRFFKQSMKNSEGKEAIGKKAASLVSNYETIVIDAGSTTLQLAKHLTGIGITIIVTAVNIAEELEEKEGITTILTGGIFRTRTTTLLNPLMEESLSQVYADKVFVGVTGFSTKFGFTCNDFQEADVKKLLIRSAKQIYWLIDSTKIDKVGTIKISDINPDYTIITDDGIDPHMKEDLEQRCKLIITERR
jgi:DeoR/GlpR family transcriptional regulator of sugar metabolism